MGCVTHGHGINKRSETAMKAAIISVSMTCDSYHETEIFHLTAQEVGSMPALDAQAARYTGKTRARGKRAHIRTLQDS